MPKYNPTLEFNGFTLKNGLVTLAGTTVGQVVHAQGQWDAAMHRPDAGPTHSGMEYLSTHADAHGGFAAVMARFTQIRR